MAHIAVMKVDGSGTVEKFQEFTLLAEAQAHIDPLLAQYPDAYAVVRPEGGPRDWVADTGAKTLVYSDVLAVAEAAAWAAETDPDEDFQSDITTEVGPAIAAITDPETKAAFEALIDVMAGKGPKGAKVKGRK